MIYVVNLIRNIALALLSALDIAMFGRAILSWIDPMGDGPLSSILYTITEPIILPVRKLCAKLHLFEGFPLDIPYMITIILLYLLQMMLMM